MSAIRCARANSAPAPSGRRDVAALLGRSAGDLVFVVAFGLLALALYRRRPAEPAVGPLLVAAAALFGSTLSVAAGLPVLALAVGGPPVWMFQLSTVAIYSLAWGAVVATSLVFVPGHPWLSRRPRVVLAVAYLAPLAAMAVWTTSVSAVMADPLRRLGLLDAGQAVVTAVALLTGLLAGVVAYRHAEQPADRARLRWVAGGGAVATLTGIALWTVPTLLRGQPLLPADAFGLSGLPFVAGVGVALRRHQLFAIERLVNRSLVYSAVLALLAAGYALLVTALVSGLRLSGTLAAGLAAAAAALAVLPVRSRAQRAVNHLMYGQRDEPAGVLAELGERLQSVLLPADVAAVIVDTIARSLRVPYVGLDIVDADGGLHVVAERGVERGPMHAEPLLHHGAEVGRLRVSGRGPEDPLDPTDLDLVGSLARQVGPAVQAVRLHADLVRARAAVVTLREEERRRLRRDLHDGIGPVLATIALKAGLAARTVPDGPAKDLLGQIGTEVSDGLGDVRRLAEELRPPVIDELGLVGALRRRAEALSGSLVVEIDAPSERLALPAAVESAAYGIAVEAMTNAVRHSGGSRCTVSVVVNGRGSRGRRPRRRIGPVCRSGPRRRAPVDARAGGRARRAVRGAVDARGHRGQGDAPDRPGDAAVIRVVVADDHPVFLGGLRTVLDAEDDVTVVGVATGGRTAVDAVAAHHPDVAVLDIAMPDGDGLWAATAIRTSDAATRVLVLTMSDDEESVFAALRAGAHGYVLKGAGPDEIVSAVRAVARGEAVFGAGIARPDARALLPGRAGAHRSPSSPSGSTRCSACSRRGSTTPPWPAGWP